MLARSVLSCVVGSMAAVSLVLASAGPASADDSVVQKVDRISAQVAAVAPAIPMTTHGAASSAPRISLGSTARDGIGVQVETERGPVATTIRLPDTMSDARPMVSRTGLVVYRSSRNAGSAIAVQKDTQGVTRVMVVIPDRAKKHSFAFSMDGFTPYVASTGEAFFTRSDGALFPVNAPWAKDSRGASVQTYYEVTGSQLVQVVVPSGDTAYPIVADPSWMWYYGWYGAKLTRSETSNARSWTAAATQCANIAQRYPNAGIACVVFITYITIQANLAESDRPQSCLFIAVIPAPVIWRVKC
jgi:hypothetical protein